MSRRWIAGGLVALAAVVGVLLLTLHSSQRSTHESLSLSNLGGLHEYAIRGNRGPGGIGPWVIGHVLTNFRLPAAAHRRLAPTGISWVLDRWRGARARFAAVKNHNYGPPSNQVALELTRAAVGGCIGPDCPLPPVRLHLPLRPDQPWTQERIASGARSYRDGYFRFDHRLYYVMYWLGPNAPANDRAAVLQALESIRPRR